MAALTLLSAAARAVTSSVTVRAVWLADDVFVLRRCACGCPHEVHKHLRAGSDCGFHGRTVCPSYRYRPFARRSTT